MMWMHTKEYVNDRTGNLSTYYSKADDHDGNEERLINAERSQMTSRHDEQGRSGVLIGGLCSLCFNS